MRKKDKYFSLLYIYLERQLPYFKDVLMNLRNDVTRRFKIYSKKRFGRENKKSLFLQEHSISFKNSAYKIDL